MRQTPAAASVGFWNGWRLLDLALCPWLAALGGAVLWPEQTNLPFSPWPPPTHQPHPAPTPAQICRCFQAEGPFWGRQYLFWHGGKPLTLIYEVFSTSLEEFLGSPHLGPGPAASQLPSGPAADS